MKLLGIAITYNEGPRVPYVMPYYERLGIDKLIVFDNMSTDNTRELLSKYPFVEIKDYDTGGIFNESMNATIKNHYWKSYAPEYDWCVCADFDEIVYTRRPIREILHEQEEKGGTIMRKIMLNLVSREFPDISDGRLLHEVLGKGTPWIKLVGCEDAPGIWGYKPMFFDLKKITEMNACVGSHDCSPVGDVSYFESDDFEVFHLKYLDMDFLLGNSKGQSDRYNKDGMSVGTRYDILSKKENLENIYLTLENGATPIV